MKNKFQTTRDIIRRCREYVSGKTLDFGAGNAKYRDIIKSAADEYVAFDLMPGPNIDVVGDVLNSPFADNEFDTVISTQVLEHVPKPWLMIKEIHRILKPGGVCILTAPFLTPYHADPHDYFRYTTEGMKSLFDDGFETVECDYYGKSFMVLSEFIHFVFFDPYKQQRRGGFRMMESIQKIAKFLDKFTRNDKIYNNVYIIAKKFI
jgi:ubiquinone/menaquinone biosynthesis C-methylase UbiE